MRKGVSRLSDLRLMIGRVISTKLKNTATVLVVRVAMHPLYKKTFKQSKKYLAHDSIGVKDGDLVEVINCKPMSRKKSWQIVKVVGKSLAEIVLEKMKKEAEEIIAEVMPEQSSENSEVSEKKKARKKKETK